MLLFVFFLVCASRTIACFRYGERVSFIAMESDNRSRSREGAVSHEDYEWDAQRLNFRHCYIDLKLTLSKATEHMSRHFGFHAS